MTQADLLGPEKGEDAFRTIAEVAALTGVPAHVLRYWEERFPQLSPLKRAGNRRYYRNADIAVVRELDRLLRQEGYTLKGAAKALAGEDPLVAVRRVRDRLAAALAAA